MGKVIQISKFVDQAIENNKTVRGLKDDVTVLKQDVAVLKQDVAILKQDVAVLKQDVAEIRVQIFHINAKMEQLDHKMNLVLELAIATGEDRQRVQKVEKTVIVCDDRLDVVEVALGNHIKDPKAHSNRRT